MSSSSSSSSGGSKGNKWTNKIYFNPYADNIIHCEVEVNSIVFSIMGNDAGIYGLLEDDTGIYYLIKNSTVIYHNTEIENEDDTEVEDDTEIYYAIYDYSKLWDTSRNQVNQGSQDDTEVDYLFEDEPIFSCAIDDGILMFYVFEDSEGVCCYIEDERGLYSLVKGDPIMSDVLDEKQLIETFNSIVETEEKIEMIHAYKHKVSEMQLTSFIIYHLFIVFKTENWWWSIEKNSEGITIQRSKNQSAVTCFIRHENRVSSITLVKESIGRRSVGDLICWLDKEKELKKHYHFLFSNCKTFAKRVFDYVAISSNLYWFDGALR